MPWCLAALRYLLHCVLSLLYLWGLPYGMLSLITLKKTHLIIMRANCTTQNCLICHHKSLHINGTTAYCSPGPSSKLPMTSCDSVHHCPQLYSIIVGWFVAMVTIKLQVSTLYQYPYKNWYWDWVELTNWIKWPLTLNWHWHYIGILGHWCCIDLSWIGFSIGKKKFVDVRIIELYWMGLDWVEFGWGWTLDRHWHTIGTVWLNVLLL